MNCNCPENYTNIGDECIKTTIINNIECPPGCTLITLPNGNAVCSCVDSVTPIEQPLKKPIYFDNVNYFKDVSWTISFKPNEGWNSYFSFYPDYSVGHNGFFQTGYNWGTSKGTIWSHLLNNNSFGIFQGVKHGFALEFPISNGGGNKILNSLSLDVEAKRYLNGYDEVFYPNKGITDMYIYNSKNNSGNLVLHPQESLIVNRKYPYLQDGKQHISSTFTEGKQITNYFFNRLVNQKNGINQFIRDENNIFKTINPKAVSFTGKRLTERISGDSFIAHIENTQDSQFNILIKYAVSEETITE